MSERNQRDLKERKVIAERLSYFGGRNINEEVGRLYGKDVRTSIVGGTVFIYRGEDR